MVLDDEQNERFFDTMDALLYYVNDRFRVVEGFTLDYASPLDDVKSSLVAHTLWDNVGIIDDFVRDNPFGLSRRCLDIAASWKSALPGFYTLVRYQSGRALLMSEAGVFSVGGVTYELEEEIGPAPAYVEMVLLPFEGQIVYDGFLQAYDTERTAAEAQRIQDEFEDRCSGGIAATADDFIRQAEKYLQAQRDKELEDLLADVSRSAVNGGGAEETLPPGFHRGALAGLGAVDRSQAVAEHFADEGVLGRRVAPTAREFDERVRRREPATSLAACLMMLTKPHLESIAGALGMGGLSHLRKAEMVGELVAELPNSPMALESRLLMADDAEYEMVRRLAERGRVDFALGDRGRHADDWPVEPYVFMFRGRGGYTALVPDELQRLVAAVDFAGIDRVRRQQKQALRCIDACMTLCGAAVIDDVYDQYRALVSDVLSRDDFEQLALGLAQYGEAPFDVWTYVPVDYLVHYTLSPAFVATEYALSQREALTGLYRNIETGELRHGSVERMVGHVRDGLATELEKLEQYKRDLVESQLNLPMKPLSRSLLENDVIGELLDDPNVVRLRDFVDERIPDGQDDFTFADRFVESVVMTAIESGTLQSMYGTAVDWGVEGCCEDDERLPTLMTNVYNAMPSWENNGWSPQELYERVTGRKMFFNDDGSIMKVGADDLCPCGSGKKYRDCCGK